MPAPTDTAAPRPPLRCLVLAECAAHTRVLNAAVPRPRVRPHALAFDLSQILPQASIHILHIPASVLPAVPLQWHSAPAKNTRSNILFDRTFDRTCRSSWCLRRICVICSSWCSELAFSALWLPSACVKTHVRKTLLQPGFRHVLRRVFGHAAKMATIVCLAPPWVCIHCAFMQLLERACMPWHRWPTRVFVCN